MKKSRYTEEQIAFALKQAVTGTPVAEVIRRMGVSEQTFYRWTEDPHRFKSDPYRLTSGLNT